MKEGIKKEAKKERTCSFCKFCIRDRLGQFYCIKKKRFLYPSEEQFYYTCQNFKKYS